MPESETHRELVRLLSRQILDNAGPSWATFIDGAALGKRTGVPPAVGDFRPDIYAIERGSRRTVIGEAKTADDIDNNHTYRQLAAYFEHLAREPVGEIWMAVPMLMGGTAHRVCRSVRQRLGMIQIPFFITGWFLGSAPIVETWCG